MIIRKGIVGLVGSSAESESDADLHKYFKYSAERDQLVATKPITTTLNSFYLGEQHKISSGAENIFFTNLTTKVDWYPLWGGVPDQSVIANQSAGCFAPSGRVYGDFIDTEFYGPVGTGIMEWQDEVEAFGINLSMFAIEFVPAEDLIAGMEIFYEVYEGADHNGGGHEVYKQKLVITDETAMVADGVTSFVFWFDHPLEIHQGSAARFYGVTGPSNDADGSHGHTLLKIYNSAAFPSRPYIGVKFRIFEDKDLAFKTDIVSEFEVDVILTSHSGAVLIDNNGDVMRDKV